MGNLCTLRNFLYWLNFPHIALKGRKKSSEIWYSLPCFFSIIKHFYALFILLIFDTPIISAAYLCTPFSSVLSDLISVQLEICFQYIYFFHGTSQYICFCNHKICLWVKELEFYSINVVWNVSREESNTIFQLSGYSNKWIPVTCYTHRLVPLSGLI